MKKDPITNLFDTLHGTFDTEEPLEGHQERFLDKLNPIPSVKPLTNNKKPTLRYVSIAATLILLCSLSMVIFYTSSPSINEQVVEISPEISKTEFYFANLITQEVNKLQSESSPATKQIIADTMDQLDKLEKNYKSLENDLINGGNSKFILSAMITNFQTRIDLLEDVLYQVEEIKKIKNRDHEDTII